MIATTADGATSIFAADLNGDGNPDVLSASSLDNKIAWYANLLASAASFGTGCGAPNSLTLSASLPRIGTAWQLSTTNVDSSSPAAYTYLGVTRGLGADLWVNGQHSQGCSVWIDMIVGSTAALAINGAATSSINVPNNAALIGMYVTAQSVCLTFQNSANLLSSNGVQGIVGY